MLGISLTQLARWLYLAVQSTVRSDINHTHTALRLRQAEENILPISVSKDLITHAWSCACVLCMCVHYSVCVSDSLGSSRRQVFPAECEGSVNKGPRTGSLHFSFCSRLFIVKVQMSCTAQHVCHYHRDLFVC